MNTPGTQLVLTSVEYLDYKKKLLIAVLAYIDLPPILGLFDVVHGIC